MLTPFGKVLRIFRLNRGELLKEMAEKLGVTPAYLSAIENGKKEPTQELMKRIYQNYDLQKDELQQLEDARAKTLQQIQINFHRPQDEELGLLFARKLNTLSDFQRTKIMDILYEKK